MTAKNKFIESFEIIATEVHNTAKEKGWWDVQGSDDWIKKEYNGEQDRWIFTQEDMKSAYEAGQKNPPPNIAEKLFLVISEIVEAGEALRNGNPMSDKIPEFTNFEEEIGDAGIRIKDLVKFLKLRAAEAELAKAEYNKTRPHKHGGKEF